MMHVLEHLLALDCSQVTTSCTVYLLPPPPTESCDMHFSSSPVIPASKGNVTSVSLPETAAAPAGLLGWVKGAVGSGGLLSRVAEKAKSSVDSMITTLDPQMREFLCM
jgi:hypothetical protein